MLKNFKFIFKDFKKASKYAEFYDKTVHNPFLQNNNEPQIIHNKTYVWVENNNQYLQ